MKKSTDLQIKIALTPSQLSFLPAMIDKMNSEPEMLMDRLVIRNDVLSVSCHDLGDVLEMATRANIVSLEVARLKNQIRLALNALLKSDQINTHQRKNFLTSSRSLGL